MLLLACFNDHKTMYKQEDLCAVDDWVCDSSTARFMAILHQYGNKCKFAVVGMDERLV